MVVRPIGHQVPMSPDWPAATATPWHIAVSAHRPPADTGEAGVRDDVDARGDADGAAADAYVAAESVVCWRAY